MSELMMKNRDGPQALQDDVPFRHERSCLFKVSVS